MLMSKSMKKVECFMLKKDSDMRQLFFLKASIRRGTLQVVYTLMFVLYLFLEIKRKLLNQGIYLKLMKCCRVLIINCKFLNLLKSVDQFYLESVFALVVNQRSS